MMKTLYKNVKNELKFNATSLWQLGVIIAGGWLIGEIISVFVMVFAKPDEYFSVGSVLGPITLSFMALAYGFYYFSVALNIAIGMSRTRKAYTASMFIAAYLQLAAGFALAVFLCFASKGLHALFFRDLPLEADIAVALLQNAHYALAGLLVALIIGMLAGVCVHRYGRVAFWILWAIWMGLALFGSNLATIVSKHDTSTFVGRVACGIADWAGNFSTPIWIFIGCAFLAVIFLAAVQLVRRATVKQ